MKRTVKNGDIIFDGINTRSELERRAFVELEELQDIEEELGINLITLFKAIKNGFYGTMFGLEKNIARKHGGPLFFELKNVDIKEFDGKLSFIHYLGDLSYSDFLVYEFENYGKTWALTKEEIE